MLSHLCGKRTTPMPRNSLPNNHRPMWLSREDQDCFSFFRSSFRRMKYQTTSHRTLSSRASNASTIGFLWLGVRRANDKSPVRNSHRATKTLPSAVSKKRGYLSVRCLVAGSAHQSSRHSFATCAESVARMLIPHSGQTYTSSAPMSVSGWPFILISSHSMKS